MARTIFLALLTVLLAAAPAIAADGGPAVSDPNGKLSVEGGHYDDEQSFLARGSYSILLGHSFGLQADGALGRIDEDTMGGAGLHLFTRDPSSYLLGLYGSYHTWDSIDIWRTAVEFQLYVHQFSIEGLGGYESVNGPLTSNGFAAVNTDDKHGFGLIDLAYYPIDDLKLYVGYHYEDATSLGSAGVDICCARAALQSPSSPKAISATVSSTASPAVSRSISVPIPANRSSSATVPRIPRTTRPSSRCAPRAQTSARSIHRLSSRPRRTDNASVRRARSKPATRPAHSTATTSASIRSRCRTTVA